MNPKTLLMRTLVGCAVLVVLPTADAQERSGKQVVEAVCSSCHGKGEKGAPKIGDRKAWSARAQQGLSSLTAPGPSSGSP